MSFPFPVFLRLHVHGNVYAVSWMPSVDGVMIAQDPLISLRQGRIAPGVDIMAGDVLDEFTRFLNLSMTEQDYTDLAIAYFGANAAAILPRYPVTPNTPPGYTAAALFGDYLFVCPTRLLLQQFSAFTADRGAGVFQFEFAHVPSWVQCPGVFCNEVPWRVAHSADIAFVLGNTFEFMGAPGPTSDERQLSTAMRQFWVTFAATGAPAPPSVWPPWSSNAATEAFLRLDAPQSLVGSRWRSVECEFWNEFGRYPPSADPAADRSLVTVIAVTLGVLLGVAVVGVWWWWRRRPQLHVDIVAPSSSSSIETATSDHYQAL
jgi:carboxylesterase type B